MDMTTAAALAAAAQSLIGDALATPLVPPLSTLPFQSQPSYYCCGAAPAFCILTSPCCANVCGKFIEGSGRALASRSAADCSYCVSVRLESHAGDMQRQALARDACVDSKSAQKMAGLLQLYRAALALHAACAGIQPQVAPLPGQAIFAVRSHLMIPSVAECASHCTPLHTAAAILIRSTEFMQCTEANRAFFQDGHGMYAASCCAGQ